MVLLCKCLCPRDQLYRQSVLQNCFLFITVIDQRTVVSDHIGVWKMNGETFKVGLHQKDAVERAAGAQDHAMPCLSHFPELPGKSGRDRSVLSEQCSVNI